MSVAARRSVSARLPDFPWDGLTAHAATARSHPDGIVDLSIGTPVDPTPSVAQVALAAAADAPGYPTTIGIPAVRQAAIDWLARNHGVTGIGLDGVLPVVGSKELIAGLPLHLGIGPGDLVVLPEVAYPTYEVGAALAGAETLATDSLTAIGPRVPALLYLNSPSNPTGRVLPPAHLRKVVEWCRERGVLLVSDECYIENSWEGPVTSVLHPDVSGGSTEGLLAIHSLSKRSNLAGYRCAFVAGDPAVVGELLAVRKNLGLIMPLPQQHAMIAALGDDAHALEQHGRYAARRSRLRSALERAGFRVDHSEASLYLWSTRGEDCWDTVAWLAERGILVAPGAFYGAAGAQHVRVAFTATDERIDAAAARLG
ncbi:MAG TPA: succinyldiaminopimelate transaminase [Nocardioides sp.]